MERPSCLSGICCAPRACCPCLPQPVQPCADGLDWLPNQVFDSSGHWLLCSATVRCTDPIPVFCAGGPCRGGLDENQLSEKMGMCIGFGSEIQSCRFPDAAFVIYNQSGNPEI